MDSLLSFLRLRRAPRWSPAEFCWLPPVASEDDAERRDHGLLAGGLALLLSRCSRKVAERDYPAALAAYRLLKRQLQRGDATRVPAQLLSELSHEIAQVADQATRQAALRCLRRARPLAQPALQAG